MISQPDIVVVHSPSDRRTPKIALPGAVVFLLAYVAISPLVGMLVDRDLPLPTASGETLAAFYSANSAAAALGAGLQALSVAGFAVFAAAVLPRLGPAARRLRTVAIFSVTAMLASSALTFVLAAWAYSVSPETVEALRMAGFYAGGVANVAALGGFVFGASRILGGTGQIGKGVRVLGYVAGALAMLSVISLAIYYANLFLPLGRMLSMVWTVAAAIALARRARF